MENFKSLNKYYDDLKSGYPKLTDFELLSIAVQIQRNDILIAGLTVSQLDKHPSALEKIAILLDEKQEN
ncbi:hypothetical protein QLS31_13365 [Flavobacterium sp. XS2P24]|jgi:hypothetical protein|uniref:hypothetical protein n=1 Tax=Flavobacterium sp. XS2P24 TaxID=3041249 RepID=UPI0024A89A8E|nr:hypothetical protein [Flavobacterium sp. XS2P24]MDI6050818.1 hypothetical protein [Flavobacterium sp. XS2P24]